MTQSIVAAYCENKQSIRAISHETGMTYRVVRKALLDEGITIRSQAETVHLAQGNHVIITEEAKEFLYGEMLGDGHIQAQSDYSATFQRSSNTAEYLEWISVRLNAYGFETFNVSENSAGGFKVGTRHYAELKAIHEAWYPKGKKRIPDGLCLTPLVCLQWYLGDGSVNRYHNGEIKGLMLWSMGLPKCDVMKLRDLLRNEGFSVNRHPSSNSLYICHDSVWQFLRWIGPLPSAIVDIYGYKFKAVSNGAEKHTPISC